MIRRAAVGAAVLSGLLLFSPAASPAAAIVVRPGGVLPVHATGFAAHARVELLLRELRVARLVIANRAGVVDLAYRVPATIGSYTLLLVGAPPLTRRRVGTVVVVVPRLVTIRFRVSTGGQGTGSGQHHRPPAGTGFDAGRWLIIAALSIGSGTIVLILAKRRRHRPAQPIVTGNSSSP